MIELQHLLPEPTQLSAYRRQRPSSSWDDGDFQGLKLAIRRQLNREQDGLCVYCECLLSEDGGHIEHIKPREPNRNLTFVYDNLAHSCNGPGHCGHHKQRQTIPVEPRPGCNRFFELMALDGRIGPAFGLAEDEAKQAEETVRILGLNVPALAWQRKGFVAAINALPDPDERAEFVSTQPFRWSLRGV